MSPEARPPTQRRPLALALAVTLLMLLLLGLGIYGWLRGFEQGSWEARQRAATSAAAADLSAWFDRVSEGLRVAAVLDGELLSEHPETLQALLLPELPILEILRVDAAGRPLASAHLRRPLLAEQFSIPAANWFHVASGGSRYLGSLEPEPADGAYLLLALPAADGGVLVARLRARDLWQRVEDVGFGDGGRAYLLDRRGRVIADPEAATVALNEAGRMVTPADSRWDGREIQQDGEPLLPQLRRAPEGRWSGRLIGPDGRELLARSEIVSAAELGPDGRSVAGSQWHLLTTLPLSEAEAWSRRLATWLIGAGALLGSLALALVAWLYARPVGLARPADPRAEAAGQGDRSPEARGDRGAAEPGEALDHTRPLSRDDVERLRAAFDDMAHQVGDIDRLTSEFLATISHELRTPLNSVIGYAELILSGVDGPLDEEMRKDVQAIYENGHQLLRMVNDLLDLAKIEAGRLELELVRLAPADLLTEAAEAQQSAIEGKGLSLSLDPAPDLPPIWGDPVRLRQVLDSLISNAIKFTEEGGIRLGARQEGDWLAITVADTGIGISEADRETIFERFRQLDGSFTRRAEGTGLGLAISRHLVRMHGGRITVESQPGEGSRFTIQLPIEETPTHARGLAIGSLL